MGRCEKNGPEALLEKMKGENFQKHEPTISRSSVNSKEDKMREKPHIGR